VPQFDWSTVYTHVPSDRPYPIPSEYDPNLALALVWGESMEEAKQRALRFIEQTVIEGQDSAGNGIITNLDYLRSHLDRLLTF
jgi:acetyl-CoA carboxylase, biotin carboxylase subunit